MRTETSPLVFSVFNRGAHQLSSRLLDTASQEEQIRQSILFILSTDCGERPLFPEYGTRLRRYLFRRNTDSLLSDMSAHVSEKLAELEPRIILEEVRAERPSETSPRIDLVVRYRIRENDLRQTIRFPVGLME